MASTEGFQGIAVPSSTPPEGVTSNRYARPASWPTTALEDVAQIIGGRIRTAKRPARERAGPGRQRHESSQGAKAELRSAMLPPRCVTAKERSSRVRQPKPRNGEAPRC